MVEDIIAMHHAEAFADLDEPARPALRCTLRLPLQGPWSYGITGHRDGRHGV